MILQDVVAGREVLHREPAVAGGHVAAASADHHAGLAPVRRGRDKKRLHGTSGLVHGDARDAARRLQDQDHRGVADRRLLGGGGAVPCRPGRELVGAGLQPGHDERAVRLGDGLQRHDHHGPGHARRLGHHRGSCDGLAGLVPDLPGDGPAGLERDVAQVHHGVTGPHVGVHPLGGEAAGLHGEGVGPGRHALDGEAPVRSRLRPQDLGQRAHAGLAGHVLRGHAARLWPRVGVDEAALDGDALLHAQLHVHVTLAIEDDTAKKLAKVHIHKAIDRRL